MITLSSNRQPIPVDPDAPVPGILLEGDENDNTLEGAANDDTMLAATTT